jgi:hypothetical protein
MAVHHSKSHAAEFVKILSRRGRNALRVILAHSNGPEELCRALGTHAVPVVTENERKTGLARSSRTIDLFPESMRKPVSADLKAIDLTEEAGKAGAL